MKKISTGTGKTKKLLTTAIIWAACGLYNWGTVMAELDYRDRMDWPALHNSSRDNVGISAFFAAAGPFGVPVAAFLITSLNQRGWELWQK